jgi:hypothetical protein
MIFTFWMTSVTTVSRYGIFGLVLKASVLKLVTGFGFNLLVTLILLFGWKCYDENCC